MPKLNLSAEASRLPNAWQSTVLGQAAGAKVKVLRMDASAYPPEIHPFIEALLVVDGHMNLEIDGQLIRVQTGEVFLVPAGQPHAVAAGSQGTLVIIDQ